jgi:hypothetical protein
VVNDPDHKDQAPTAAEAAATRRRWINLGEILAVTAVIISALTLWLNWSERSDSSAQHAAETNRAAVRAATLVMTAEPANSGAALTVRPVSPDQAIMGQTIRFPDALKIDPVETTGPPRIESDWFDGHVKRARKKANMPDVSRGDERLPVILETRFVADGQPHDDIAIYDIGYTIRGGLLGGHDVHLRGISLVKRVKGKAAMAALNARWNSVGTHRTD